jgi:hypothetical protein
MQSIFVILVIAAQIFPITSTPVALPWGPPQGHPPGPPGAVASVDTTVAVIVTTTLGAGPAPPPTNIQKTTLALNQNNVVRPTVIPTKATTPVAVQPPASAQQTAAASTQGTGSSSSYISTALDGHNNHRKCHKASGLKWDDTLANDASQLGAACNWHHDV